MQAQHPPIHVTGWPAVILHCYFSCNKACIPFGLTPHVVCRVLQAVLSSHGTVATSNGRLSNAQQLAENSKLLQALMLCAIELTSYCITGNASFPAITSQLGHSCMALEVWQAVGLFLCYLPAETGIKLPDSVSSYLLFMRVRITEQLAWKSGSSVYQAICEGGGGSCAIGDYSLLSSLLDNVSALARSRTYATATVIGRSHATDADSISFIQHCNWVMTLVLEKHLDLLFGQHLSSIVACCVYSIVRVHQGTVSFKTIVDSMLQLFPHQSMQDFKQCEIQQATDHSVAVLGSTRQFYNAVFLPAIESILYEGFPDMPSTGSDHTSSQNTVEDPVSDQRKTGKFKQAMKERRPALQSLSAADLNVRAGKFRKMQG